MSCYNIQQIIQIARSGSPFYQQLYQHLSDGNLSLTELPVATPEVVREITKGNHCQFMIDNPTNGICYSSSGTTGIAKFSMFDREEWKINNILIAKMHQEMQTIKAGDIVGNLATTGHASFMAVHDVLNHFPHPVSEISIGGDRSFDDIAKLLENFECNILAGVYTTFLSLSVWLLQRGLKNTIVTTILGGGEILFPSQKSIIEKAFPNACIASFVYGATDTGLIGYNCDLNDLTIFRPFHEACIVEIIDPETNRPITKAGKVGYLTISNLLRKHSPIVRYCNNDIAEWLDNPNSESPRFRLVKRKYPKITIANSFISGNDLADLFVNCGAQVDLIRLQLRISENSGRPRLSFIFCTLADCSGASEVLKESFKEHHLDLFKSYMSGQLDLDFNHVPIQEFSSQDRKRAKLIVDERLT